MPHRTQAISPLPDYHGRYDTQYDPSFVKRGNYYLLIFHILTSL